MGTSRNPKADLDHRTFLDGAIYLYRRKTSKRGMWDIRLKILGHRGDVAPKHYPVVSSRRGLWLGGGPTRYRLWQLLHKSTQPKVNTTKSQHHELAIRRC